MSETLSAHALEMAQILVRMNTTSAHSNLELIDFAREHLARLGVRSRLTYSADRRKANLFATLGEGKPAGLVLAAHTDTVPWDEQAWSVDPLSAIVQDWPSEAIDGDLVSNSPRLYGRGAADTKGFIAMALANAPHFLNGRMPFSVHLALSYDAEVGCTGVHEMLADLRSAGIRPKACIVGAPTAMVPVIGHKGVYRYRCRVRGQTAHSAQTPGSVNAIEAAARIVGKLREMGDAFERSEPRDMNFDVPFSTVNVGQFHGGIADNVVPDAACFHYEFRTLPSADPYLMQKNILAYAGRTEEAMKKIAPEAGFAFDTLCEIPCFMGSDTETVTQLVQQLAGEYVTAQMAISTEAGFFKGAGIPTVVCGPGSVAQAHQNDEYVTLDQLARCENFMRELANTQTLL